MHSIARQKRAEDSTCTLFNFRVDCAARKGRGRSRMVELVYVSDVLHPRSLLDAVCVTEAAFVCRSL